LDGKKGTHKEGVLWKIKICGVNIPFFQAKGLSVLESEENDASG
jgi:hypothetical protein